MSRIRRKFIKSERELTLSSLPFGIQSAGGIEPAALESQQPTKKKESRHILWSPAVAGANGGETLQSVLLRRVEKGKERGGGH